MHTFCHAVPGKWHVMGVMLSAGGSLRWYRDTFACSEASAAKQLGRDPYDVMSDEAAQVGPGCEGLVFLPYLSGERTPYPNPHARGVFFGITLRHSRAHFVRCVMEGVAFGLRDSFEILNGMGIPIKQVRASGGGARSEVWRQIQSDVTGMVHVTINVDEGPAFGAALLAGVGTGIYPSVEEACRSTIRVVSSTEPRLGAVKSYSGYYQVYRSLYQSLKDDFDKVAALGATTDSG
jgi:xylulokinase